jgi:hypothetical protein
VFRGHSHMTKIVRTFQLVAFLIAQLTLSATAFAQATNLPNSAVPHGASAIPEEITIGTYIVGDGMGGGFIFGPSGFSTLINNGAGGATVFGPNTAGAIIGDGTGGGVLYNLKSAGTSEPGTRRAERVPPPGPRETLDPRMLVSLAILGACFITLALVMLPGRQAVAKSARNSQGAARRG